LAEYEIPIVVVGGVFVDVVNLTANRKRLTQHRLDDEDVFQHVAVLVRPRVVLGENPDIASANKPSALPTAVTFARVSMRPRHSLRHHWPSSAL